MTGFVYCIGQRGGMVKIGYSADPAKRLVKIQSDTPHALTFFGAIPGTVETEAAMHRRFSDRRSRGEWFDDADAEISSAFPTYSKPVETVEVTDLPSWLKANGMTQARMAEIVGISQATMSKLCARKFNPTIDLAWRVECATGHEITVYHWLQNNSVPSGPLPGLKPRQSAADVKPSFRAAPAVAQGGGA